MEKKKRTGKLEDSLCTKRKKTLNTVISFRYRNVGDLFSDPGANLLAGVVVLKH